MPRDIVIFGFVMPVLVPLFCLCIVIMWPVERLFRNLNVYSHVMHPPLFRLAVFFIVFCSLCLVVYD